MEIDGIIDKIDSQKNINDVAQVIVDQADFFIKMFKATKHEITKDYRINYDPIDRNILIKQIHTENNALVKASLVVTFLHHLFYDLLVDEKNHYFSLNGPDEMLIPNNSMYYINLNLIQEQNNVFFAYIIIFALESIFNKHLYVGIDFEYTAQKVALMQLCFEHYPDKRQMIFVTSPPQLLKESPHIMKAYIKLIMTNNRIRKILHGSDSKDIPYVHDTMFDKNPTHFLKFVKSLVDTRFICEYFQISQGDITKSKCTIYAALIYFKVISDEKNQELEVIEEAMGAKQDIVWNIKKLAKSQVLYAIYDVLFLKSFYYEAIHKSMDSTENQGRKIALGNVYHHLLHEIVQYIYLEKYEIVTMLKKCKEEVDPINNFMIKKTKESGTITLINIYNQIFPGTIIDKPEFYVELDKLTLVNYLRGSLLLLFKKIIYTIVTQKYRVYKDRNTPYVERLSNDYIYQVFDKLKFKRLSSFIKRFEESVKEKLEKNRY